jgi:lipooligosaccharide transport system permease protein
MKESLFLSLQVCKRNWTVYKKDFFSNISPSLADPVLILVTLGLGLGTYVNQIDGKSYTAYLSPSLPIATALFTSFFETSYGFYVRLTFENIYKAMLTTPIGPLEVVLGEFIWVGLKGGLTALGVTLVLFFCGLVQNPIFIPFTAIIGFFVAVGCGSIGFIASALIKNINQIQSVYSFLIAPLFYLSGLFFPLDNTHIAIKIFAHMFPLYPALKISQAIYWNENILHSIFTYFPIILIQCIIFCCISYPLIRKKLISV